jgi:hypothetical protein
MTPARQSPGAALVDYLVTAYGLAGFERDLTFRLDVFAAEAIAAERERCVKIAENPGFIQAQDTEWDMGVEYAKAFIARAIRSGREP